ncbi:hypothetical protein EJV47_23175 [Hymenobacter gummosus]|uniref:Copper-binding protein MbnP-like domain-containing protein n=1 Tax=Hymenobacter gummosus TaxID=1776032 RepID=A0A3S0J6Q3_9BACT|nr:MbnP family protein [Hymenobacter gummosus]RTQ46058.1 hypothetical protein EJV47_23175 [Hymenobacter gummosus]
MHRILYPAVVALLLLSGCESKNEQPKPATGKVEIQVENVAGSSTLALNTPYTTAAGETFRVTELRYYLSNVQLQRADGSTWAAPDSYYLIDQAQTASQHLELKEVPEGDYTKLLLTIGVDSARNVAGAQTGALDPVHGMFWDWNSGYIFLRLNGTSPQAPGNGGLFYDVAGFRHPYNTIRRVALGLPGGSAATLHVRAEAVPDVHIKANVLKMFDGPNAIRFGQLSSVAGGSGAVKLADNYAAGMFRIDHVHGN